MQRLQLNPEEKISRKEYLKRKKKQQKKINEFNKSRIIIGTCMVLLGIYVCVQFYIYNRTNNFKYVEGENVDKQDVYNMYYVTDGYTYDPVYSLSQISSNGFNDTSLYQNVGITGIYSTNDYIYGLKENGLYRIKKDTKELENVIEKDVEKYTIYKEEIYVICGENQELKRFNPDTKELEDLNQNSIVEILVDDNYVFAVKDLKTKKVLLRINKDGNDLKELVNDQNVSYIIQDMNSIYYVNKADEDKIYTVSKEGTDNEKLADICSNSDSGDLKEIDGSKYMVVNMGYLYYINSKENDNLWKLNLATKDNSKEISVPVEILQNVDGTLFYKMKNEMGVYLYNLESKFMSQVTKRKVKEFRVGEKIAEEDIKYDGNILKN